MLLFSLNLFLMVFKIYPLQQICSVDEQCEEEHSQNCRFEYNDEGIGQEDLEEVHSPEEIGPEAEYLIESQEVLVPLVVFCNCCCCRGLTRSVGDDGLNRCRF